MTVDGEMARGGGEERRRGKRKTGGSKVRTPHRYVALVSVCRRRAGLGLGLGLDECCPEA